MQITLLNLVLEVLLLELLLFSGPLFIVLDLHHKTNNRDHPTRIDPSLYRIDPSLYRVVPDLFLSLCVIHVLLRPPTPTDDTPTPLSFVIVESVLNLIRCTSLVGRPSYYKYPSLFNRSVLQCIDRIARGTRTSVCIRTELGSGKTYVPVLLYKGIR